MGRTEVGDVTVPEINPAGTETPAEVSTPDAAPEVSEQSVVVEEPEVKKREDDDEEDEEDSEAEEEGNEEPQ